MHHIGPIVRGMFTLGTVQPLSMIPYTYAAFYHAYSSTPSTKPKKQGRGKPVKSHSGKTTPPKKTVHSRYRPGDQWNLAPVGAVSAGASTYRFTRTTNNYAELDQNSGRDTYSSGSRDRGSRHSCKCRHEARGSQTLGQASSAGQLLRALHSRVTALWSKGFASRKAGTGCDANSPVVEATIAPHPRTLATGYRDQQKAVASESSSTVTVYVLQ